MMKNQFVIQINLNKQVIFDELFYDCVFKIIHHKLCLGVIIRNGKLYLTNKIIVAFKDEEQNLFFNFDSKIDT